MMSNKHNKESEYISCDDICIHPDLIHMYADQILSLERATKLAYLFKTLGDPTRIRIMDALARSEFCVCDLAELLDLSQSATSHQLRILRNSNLVKYRKDGKMVYYSLQDNHVQELYRQGLEHIDE
ncbi:putative transcriptional regulator [Desulfitobacterium dichloroeliminans LMG P-21439]|uniref:Putative transcriptional regulator n=1 Tax=Desulfitobacterium dichloroeliminans (strain LMG P-21439 / DCA1) TaxID=871963 RepID=L0F468_DESDL|nr:metalloregulator ArsR/SmtB family transcription factor [Desulfitobacterium dichloroeliminans]AGA68619.1 putative transcriptional regulator [Desulfitobacterium dichloroeliminans LMG P-21439]